MSQQIPRTLNFTSEQIIPREEMHGLCSSASCCVDYEYRCSIFLSGPQTWPIASTRPLVMCFWSFLLSLPVWTLELELQQDELEESYGMKRQMCNVFVQSFNKNMLL